MSKDVYWDRERPVLIDGVQASRICPYDDGAGRRSCLYLQLFQRCWSIAAIESWAVAT